jgi:hypothetical protein
VDQRRYPSLHVDYDKVTDGKGKLAETFFTTKSESKAVEPKNPIKILFKAPSQMNKLKKRNLEDININKILES